MYNTWYALDSSHVRADAEKYFLESSGDGLTIIGKMEVRLNNGKVKKALWFQVE